MRAAPTTKNVITADENRFYVIKKFAFKEYEKKFAPGLNRLKMG